MSINYTAKIAVGLPYREFPEMADQLLDDDELQLIAPEFNASSYQCIAGVSVVSTSAFDYQELVDLEVLQQAIDIAKMDFFMKTGKTARVYISTDSF